jgi:hypothetical protein
MIIVVESQCLAPGGPLVGGVVRLLNLSMRLIFVTVSKIII